MIRDRKIVRLESTIIERTGEAGSRGELLASEAGSGPAFAPTLI
jgi:hypothetical protein